MRIGKDLPVVLDLPAGHARLSQQREPVRRRARSGDLLDERDELGLVAPAERAVHEPWIALEPLEPERRTERTPVWRSGRAEHEVRVGGAHGLIGTDELVRRSCGPRNLAGGEELPGLPHRERDGRLVHGDIHELSAALALADAESG